MTFRFGQFVCIRARMARVSRLRMGSDREADGPEAALGGPGPERAVAPGGHEARAGNEDLLPGPEKI